MGGGGGDGDEGLNGVRWRTKWSGEEDMGHTMIEGKGVKSRSRKLCAPSLYL